MLRQVARVRINISEERIASIIRVTRIGELGTTLLLTTNRRKLQRNNALKCRGIAVCKFIFKWRHRPLTAWECPEQYQL
jgi:hypothetical protein